MELEVKDGVEIVIHNKDFAMGYYYAEDNWSIKAVASTYEEAVEQIIPKYIESNIYPDDICVSDVKYVIYNNKQYIVDNVDRELLIYKNKYMTDYIKQHPLFKKLSEEKRQKAEALMKINFRKQKIANENSERKLLEKLKKSMITNIITSIKNIFHWIPIIWIDRDWDHTFLYIILQFKLSNMEKYLRKHGHSINSEKDADKIKMCVNLLNRIINDEYHDMIFKKHDEKWGKLELNWISMKDGSDCSKLGVKRINIITKEDSEQERKEYNNLIKIENNSKQQDIDYLFETMRKYHQGWWD